jgi:hypothetical protein
VGTVTRADFTRALAARIPQWWSHALYFQDDWKAPEPQAAESRPALADGEPYRSKYGQQSRSSRHRDRSGRRGGLLHPTGALPAAMPNFQPASRDGLQFPENWVFRGGFAVNTLDLWVNSLRENFEEYLATAVVQKPAEIPTSPSSCPKCPINFNISRINISG